MQGTPGPADLGGVVSRFAIGGAVVEAGPYGSGHIHDTFSVVMDRAAPVRRYIFQRINHAIFRDVGRLMQNICRVTEHIRARLEQEGPRCAGVQTLTVIPTRDGGTHYAAANGEQWRAYVFVEGTRTCDTVTDVRQAYEASRSYAQFQGLLADFPPPPLHETIPGFHDTPRRLDALRRAVSADPLNRARECRPEIDYALSLGGDAGRITGALARGEIPTRVTHNDTKLNNVLLDAATGRGVCVIDLDTVMPGSVLYDFGDQVRSMVGRFEENEKDLRRVGADLGRFEQIARGYLDVARPFLNAAEVRLLPFAGMLMTYEVGIRFLADHLQGDTYFKIHYPGENLDRARTQLSLVRSLRDREAELHRLVALYCG